MFLSLLLGGSVLLLDRCTKKAARRGRLPRLRKGGAVELVHIENDGLAGSLCRGSTVMTKVLPGAAFALLLMQALPRFRRMRPLQQTGTALLAAGGISNLYDRIRRGSVTDMVRFPRAPGGLGKLVWNAADLALGLGAVLVCIGSRQRGK